MSSQSFDLNAVNRPDDILFQQEIDVLVFTINSDIRPLKNAAAVLDWRLKSLLSRFIQKGFITGSLNEISLIPVEHLSKRRYLMILGDGTEAKPVLPSENKDRLEKLAQNLLKLTLKKVAISQSSFPSLKEQEIEKIFAKHKEMEIQWTQ